MDSRIDTSLVISSPPLNTTIAYNKAESSPACHICADLEPCYKRGVARSMRIFVGDCEKTKDNCPSCALLWTISALSRHSTAPHETPAEKGAVHVYTLHKDQLQMRIHDPAEGILYQNIFTTTEHTCPFPVISPMPIISEYTGSDHAVAVISRWLQECVHGHQHCNRIQAPILHPKRLVEILGPGKVILRTSSADTAGSYTALSHCWGTKRFIQTTKSSLLQYQQQIHWTDLPKTFKDAVDITRRLGIRYIWIDSLCIVQDDIDDWREEGSKMASIYSGSYLTIAASKSSDSVGGCFAKTGPSQAFELFNTNKQIYNITLRKEMYHPGVHVNRKFPIFNRAWVFQERMLSPRTIHFGPHELLWECNELKTCECTGWKFREIGASKAYILGNEDSLHHKTYIETPATRWRTLVEQYSNLELSHERDIFPAIQGIAKYFHKEIQCAYYAGLWEKSLIEDLSWYKYWGRKYRSRPKSWRAPTWSWASTRHVHWRNNSNLQVVATVVAVSTVPVGSDPYGEISGGELQLKGCCVDAMAIEVRMKTANCDVALKIVNGGREVVLDSEFYPDHATSLCRNTTFKLMELCVDEEQQVYERIGLVIATRLDGWWPNSQWHFEHYGEELVLKIV